MNKKTAGKILFGVLFVCFLASIAFLAFNAYMGHTNNEVISRDYRVQEETDDVMTDIAYEYWFSKEIRYNYDPLSVRWQNETKNLEDTKYINGEEILELKYTNSILINNLTFHGYALHLKVIPDNFTQKYYSYNYTESVCDKSIIIGEPECEERTVYCLFLYLNRANCEALKKVIT